jgi:hypothetical protein
MVGKRKSRVEINVDLIKDGVRCCFFTWIAFDWSFG